MLSKDEAVTSLPEEEPENYVTEMVAGDEAVTSLPEERPENYVTVMATQVGRAPVTPVIDEPIAPLPRPKLEPMDPEFVGLDSLAEAPFLDERTKLHRLFADYLSQARQIETIADRFDIRLDSRPKSWPIAAEPDEGLVANLFLHRDKWLKILDQIPLKSPLRYYYITSPYGMRTNKKTGVTRFHHGVDLASTWNAELRPSASGIVSFAGRNGSFGKVVRVRHAHNIETVYAHRSSINVATGDFVTEDIVLGKVGTTGRSDGMHLHYEILINDKSINPALFFKIGHQLSITGGIPREIRF
ncbi:MAG: M23 family metallopeptidase [Alphaproteobacteria bacterium]|nr:M23 family metallopeptidase [Alphaproteobacteria bacterium]